MLNAATDLFGGGSTQYETIATAWCAVGVGSCPGAPTPTPDGYADARTDPASNADSNSNADTYSDTDANAGRRPDRQRRLRGDVTPVGIHRRGCVLFRQLQLPASEADTATLA